MSAERTPEEDADSIMNCLLRALHEAKPIEAQPASPYAHGEQYGTCARCGTSRPLSALSSVLDSELEEGKQRYTKTHNNAHPIVGVCIDTAWCAKVVKAASELPKEVASKVRQKWDKPRKRSK